MDMWNPYVAAPREHLPASDKKIVYDKYHIAARLSKAVDQVRRAENKRLRAAGDERLSGTKYDWLRHPASFSEDAGARVSGPVRERPEDGAGVGLEEATAHGFRNQQNFINASCFHCGGLDRDPGH